MRSIPIVTAEQMRLLERAAMTSVSSLDLMERAGEAVAGAALELLTSGTVAAICGKGNNGGDALVALRLLKQRGADTAACLIAAPSDLSDDATIQLERARAASVEIRQGIGPLSDYCLIIDGLLGTGARGSLASVYAEAVRAVNQSGQRVLAVDLPSGLDADTGASLGEIVRAETTVTLGLPKTGLYLQNGPSHCGRVLIADIGLAQPTHNQRIANVVLDASDLWPLHSPDAHKGNRGRVCVFGGSASMPGAPALSGISALRSGAGLVTLFVPSEAQPVTAAYYPELMTRNLEDQFDANANAAIIGPGLGESAEARAVARKLIEAISAPKVIDADGLNALAEQAPIDLMSNAVLTPHPGEAAKLLKKTVEQIQSDRMQAAKDLASAFNAVVVLKGACTLVAQGDELFAIPVSEPALATAGSGDVLAGLIGGLLAQGLSPLNAAIAGAWHHAKIGQTLAKTPGFGFTAEDLSRALIGGPKKSQVQ